MICYVKNAIHWYFSVFSLISNFPINLFIWPKYTDTINEHFVYTIIIDNKGLLKSIIANSFDLNTKIRVE